MKKPVFAWRLPDVVDPPDTKCFQLEVPNDTYHLAAFYGAIYLLTRWYAWERDEAHTARLVGQRWMRVFDKLIAGNCTVAPRQGTAGAEGDDNLIRQNPDNPCELQTSIDGVNWCTFADLSKCTPRSQPGNGTPQPGAGGGCQTYHGTMGAAAPWYVPTVVNTGDTIEISGAGGAWNDGSEVAWRCPNGEGFFAGNCTGITALDSLDPLPTEPHMALLAVINGVYYNVSSGVFTIPSGITNAQVLLQPNDSVLNDNAGTIEFNITVCNNQSNPINSTYTFDLNPSGWVPLDIPSNLHNGVWVPGQGFGDTNEETSGYDYRAAGAQIDLPSFTLTDFVVTYNLVQGSNASGASPGIFIMYNDGNILTDILWTARTDGDGQTIEFHGSQTGVTNLGIFIGAGNAIHPGDGGGSALITSAQVVGQ
jgi:hypothetical protein